MVNEAGERRVGSAGIVSGCAVAVAVSRSRAKVGDVGEFCGVLRRTYEEMGVYAMRSASESGRCAGRLARRPRKEVLMGERRGDVERACNGLGQGANESEMMSTYSNWPLVCSFRIEDRHTCLPRMALCYVRKLCGE